MPEAREEVLAEDRPGCRVRRVEVPGDRVGFIGVDDAPPDFEIYNAYDGTDRPNGRAAALRGRGPSATPRRGDPR
jgi:hypothetical protein